MTVEVKICGISTPDIMDATVEAGADYVGLVFFPKSPRHVSLSKARELAEIASGRADVVALVVDPDDRLIGELGSEVGPDIIQLHGRETPERTAEVAERSGARTMKAIGVSDASDAERARAYADVADLILFDAKPPKDAVLPGGNGLPFDWTAIAPVAGDVDYMLSGGLTVQNVADGIAATGASRIDVSSGVERAPGEKDADLIRAFIQAAKSAR
ncbi:MAG: phosphoribosylanthranilate isomerase [Pseudomonadota bacterium]